MPLTLPDDATAPLIQLRGASIGYDEHPVLVDVDFTVHRGEAIAVLGPNGAGKSTLIRGILGLADVLGGTVELYGIRRGAFRQWHRLGYVPQSHTVAATIPSTVREVVTSGRLARGRIWRRLSAADKSAVAAAIDTVGLTGRESAPVGTLSGGQQRRVLIARALAAEPDILVLDEPTAGVDAENRRQLADTLRALLQSGVTLLLVTHEAGDIEALLTRTVIVDDGRIIYDGVPPTGKLDAALRIAVESGAEHDHPHGEQPGRPGLHIPAAARTVRKR